MKESGILLPVFSLPSAYGIGCLDKEAYLFVDKLKEAKQTYWQILPLGITSYGDSPYQSFSTFAINPYFISLDALCEKNWLKESDLPPQDIHSLDIDYEYLYKNRYTLLKKAYQNSHIQEDENFISWCQKSSWWLDDYALFMAIKEQYDGQSWEFWSQDLRLRKPEVLAQMKMILSDDIDFQKFMQYMGWTQWLDLKHYANRLEIKIIGDIPIYVACDSADVWAHPELFQLDDHYHPVAVAGCPPDGFSADGQLWGNPLYRWEEHKKQGYSWWIQRMNYCKEYYDVVRIDHFRGFDEYFSIPYLDETAKNGHWEKGPGYELFQTIEANIGKMNVIAEDLGYLTDTVKQLVSDCGYPGMKLLQFAFDSRDSSGAQNYLPHNYIENTIVYTGTHDNETMMGWFGSILPNEKQDLKNYLQLDTDNDEELLDKCIELIMNCISKICMIPMQDWLKLDNHARTNKPNTIGENWRWRMSKECFDQALIDKIKTITMQTHREGKM